MAGQNGHFLLYAQEESPTLDNAAAQVIELAWEPSR